MKIRLKPAVTAVAAVFLAVVAADWCPPGQGLHCAAVALGGYDALVDLDPSLWSFFVIFIGWRVRLLGFFSMVLALVALAGVIRTAGDIFGFVIAKANLKDPPGTNRYRGLRAAAIILSAAAFVLTPGFLLAATRVDPLMMSLALGAWGVALLVRIGCTLSERFVEELKERRRVIYLGLGLLAAAAWEFQCMGRVACRQAVIPIVWFSLLGVFPALALATRVRLRKLTERRSLVMCIVIWALVVGGSGFQAGLSLNRGHIIFHLLEQVLDDARGCEALVTDGVLDDMLLFMKPPEQKLISLVIDNEPSRRQELFRWAMEHGLTNITWAAEIGPRTFIDAWLRADPTNCLQRIRTSAYYFPTEERWRQGVACVREIDCQEPLGAYMRWLVAACGNHLGCRFIDDGKLSSAWETFWTILDEVDSQNCTAIANLYGMIHRGYVAGTLERSKLDRYNSVVAERVKSPKFLLRAALSGGRLYVNPLQSVQSQLDLDRLNLTVREREFIRIVSAAPNSRMSAEKAREAIRAGLKEGLVRLDRITPQLLRLDILLGDWSSAEKDAEAVLLVNNRHTAANGVLGLIKYRHGDYQAAERYLREAVVARDAEPSVANDLAFTLARIGRANEAEPFARSAVKACPKDWNFWETLAYVLIREGKVQDGNRMLKHAIELAAERKIPEGRIVRFTLDRAWAHWECRRMASLKLVLAELFSRQDLTPPQKIELLELKAKFDEASPR